MTNTIFKYELGYWLRRPLIYIFAAAFFLISLVSMLGTGGYFDGPSTSKEAVRLLNSPYEINYIFQYFNKLLLFLVPVIVGTSLYRDYKSGTFHISYSFPMAKRNYLLGKLSSALLVVILVSLSMGVALMLGEFMLGVDNPKIDDFNLSGYLFVYGVVLIPNFIFVGLLVFMVVGVSRNLYAGFICILILFLFQIIVDEAFTGYATPLTLLDPFCQNAISYETQHWTLEDMNSNQIPILGMVLYNRLFWGGTLLTIFFLFYRKFDLLHESPFKGMMPSFLTASKKEIGQRKPMIVKKLSEVVYDHSWKTQFQSMFTLAAMEFRYIVRSWMFYLFAFFGFLAVFFMLLKVTNTGEFNLLPLTRIILMAPFFFYTLILMLATFMYGGMLLHRSKSRRMNHLIDATTIPNWSLLGSKFLALVMMQITLLSFLMFCGICIQIYNGYFQFEIGQYLFKLFVLTLPTFIIWAAYSIFIHSLSPNVFVGFFLLLMTWMGVDALGQLGLTTNLLKFNALPPLVYSDFNGYGQQLSGYFLLLSYWLVSAVILLGGAYLLWRRGVDQSIIKRLALAKKRISRPVTLLLSGAVFCFLLLGFTIYKVESSSVSDAQFEQSKSTILKNFKSKFGKYANTIQPKIDSIHLALDIFPDQNAFTAKGFYTLINKSEQAIDTLIIKTGFDEITSLEISKANQVIDEDTQMQHTAYKLLEPLQIGDSINISFDVKNKSNTLFTRNSSVISNGTYIKQDILPRLGYIFNENIQEPSDSLAGKQNFYHNDADFVSISTTITTSKEQMAFAPGDLLNEKLIGNRKQYNYKAKEKVKLNFSFHSAAFEQITESYKNRQIEVYFQKGHDTNIKAMIDGVKAALDYNRTWFNEYPHEVIRIIEFPHTEHDYSATLMANNIPSSEIQFTINAEAMKEDINLPFYVMGHELTHEWFGNKTMPADALGSKMLTESITEYISLRIYEKAFGKEMANNFLNMQHKRYLRGRVKEQKEEHPLYRVRPEQQYIAYGKGAIAFNTLAHYIGTEKVNAVLKEYLNQYENRSDQYPTSIDFLNLLRDATPLEYQYLIKDYFETITFCKNTVEQLSSKPLSTGKHSLSFDLTMKKYRAGGEEHSLPLKDFVELGFYNKTRSLIQVERVLVEKELTKLEFEVGQEVTKILVDPNDLLLKEVGFGGAR